MATKIITKNSSTASAAPVAADLSAGELAINTNDGKLFYKDSGGTVRTLASKDAAAGTFATLSASGNVTLSGGTANGVLYLNGSKVATSGSALVFDGTNLGLGVTPSAWDSSWKAFQIGTRAGFVSAGDNSSIISQNARFESGWKYISTAAAGLYVAAFNGQHQWYNAPSGTAGNAITFTQAMTLDASGRLGIGTTSPGDKITVASGASAGAAMTFWANGGNSSNELYIGQGGSNEAYVFNRANQYLVFGTNNTERARIDSSGNLLVGQTTLTNAEKVGITFNGNTQTGLTINDSAGVSVNVQIFRNAGTAVGTISKTTTSTSYNTSSDYRLKENIQPMQNALGVVAQLNPVTYNWKADGSAGQGFIAHELAEVVPDCVTGEKDAVDADGNPIYQGIDTSFLVATLTAAIQELKAEVDSLKAQLNKGA